MPRTSREQAAQTRAQIVTVAARLFREKGIAGTGVADVMKAAGLTHGGFYRHFASKDALSAEAISLAVGHSLATLEQAKGTDERKQALLDYINRYLSKAHVEQRGAGCPLAALGGEATRLPSEVADCLSAGCDRAITALALAMEGDKERAAVLLAALTGTIVLARLTASRDRRDMLLSATRTSVLELVSGNLS
jgi:TetR/AcrR family transcriptional repressor of nem operon